MNMRLGNRRWQIFEVCECMVRPFWPTHKDGLLIRLSDLGSIISIEVQLDGYKQVARDVKDLIWRSAYRSPLLNIPGTWTQGGKQKYCSENSLYLRDDIQATLKNLTYYRALNSDLLRCASRTNPQEG